MITFPWARRLVDAYIFGVFSTTFLILVASQVDVNARSVAGMFLFIVVTIDVVITYRQVDFSE